MTEALSLWVDDCKPCPNGFAVARTYDDAMHMLRRFQYGTLYLDHDLADPQDRTGYDLLMQAIAEGVAPEDVRVISWNPVGRKRIEQAIANRSIAPRDAAKGEG